MTENLKYFGNQHLLKLHKTAFLCSRKIQAAAVLKCYDWAIKMRNEGKCVISGFHSPLEKDLFSILIKGKQPVIISLARGLKQKLEPELQQPMDDGRLLVITPFDETVKRVTEKTATVRNRMMIELTDEVVVGFASEGGNLKKMLQMQSGHIEYLTFGA